MIRKWFTTVFIIVPVIALFLLSGCARFPQTDPAAANDTKKSVIVLTAAGVDSAFTDALKQAVQSWRTNEKTAYDYVPDVQTIDPAMTAKWSGMPIDQIVVVGDALFPSAEEAAKALPGVSWTWLQTEPSRTGQATTQQSNVLLRTIDLSPAYAAWNDWVQQQVAAGGTLIWITRSGFPVPAVWATSEEADQVIDIDVYQSEWTDQLNAQIKAKGATQLIAFGPLEQNELAKLRATKLPVMDMYASINVRLNGAAVAASILESLQNGNWKSGVKAYSPEEAQISGK